MSQAQLDRGYRLTEILKQPQNAPVPVEEQVLAIYAATKGFVDDIPVGDVRRFESELIAFVKASHADLLDGIRDDQVPARRGQADAAIGEFQKVFAPTETPGK